MTRAFASGEAHDFDGGADHAAGRSSPLERLSLERNRSNDKKSLKIKMLEQALIEKVYQLFRSLL
jgi:predicted butyrate kinase (DUF1464 family)